MAIKKSKRMRRIVVDGQTYHWQFRQAQDQESDAFRACAVNDRKHPLLVYFPSLSSPSGIPYIEGHSQARDVNLYTPVWAGTFIRYGLTHGWEPQTRGINIEDGVKVLKALAFTPLQN